ncbi:MAG: hypothetical protein IH956_08015 [Chloroflexi bacterium]|nr:hypothetical protein [Chloroflexota bacterium]
MNNSHIAEVFQDIARLLEMKGEPGYTVRAYRQAGATIRELPDEVGDLLRAGKDLRELPGIGKAISDKTRELVGTGQLRFYERLKAEFPEGVRGLLQVPGLGPKTALRVWKELGVTTLSELEAAVLDGRLASLPRFSQRSAENILRHIRDIPANGDR